MKGKQVYFKVLEYGNSTVNEKQRRAFVIEEHKHSVVVQYIEKGKKIKKELPNGEYQKTPIWLEFV